MDALENGRNYNAVDLSFALFDDFNVLGANYHVYFVVYREIVEHIENMPDKADFAVGYNRAVHYIAVAYKVGYERVFRFVVNVYGRAYLLNRAVVHNDYRVAHSQGFFLVVRNVNKGYAELFVHFFKLQLHILAHFKVERAERFVQKKNFRLVYDSAGDCYSLLLSARKGGYVAFFELFEVDHFKRARNLFVDNLFGKVLLFDNLLALGVRVYRVYFFEFKPVGNVVVNVKMREKRVTLENRVDRAHIRRNGSYVPAVQKYLPAVRHFEARYHS